MSRETHGNANIILAKKRAKTIYEHARRTKARAVRHHTPPYIAYKLHLTTGSLFSVFRAQEAAEDYDYHPNSVVAEFQARMPPVCIQCAFSICSFQNSSL